MSQVIIDQKLLNHLKEFLEANSAFNQIPLDYCARALHLNEEECKDTYTPEGAICGTEHQTYPIFAFDTKKLENIVNNPKIKDQSEAIKRINAYQMLLACKDHYEELLSRAIRTLGWTTLVRDKPQDPLQAEGIWDCPFGVFGSLIFVSYRANEPRVFVVERGIVTPLDMTYNQFIENPPISEAEFERAKRHRIIDEQIKYDKLLENLLGLLEQEWNIIKSRG